MAVDSGVKMAGEDLNMVPSIAPVIAVVRCSIILSSSIQDTFLHPTCSENLITTRQTCVEPVDVDLSKKKLIKIEL